MRNKLEGQGVLEKQPRSKAVFEPGLWDPKKSYESDVEPPAPPPAPPDPPIDDPPTSGRSGDIPSQPATMMRTNGTYDSTSQPGLELGKPIYRQEPKVSF